MLGFDEEVPSRQQADNKPDEEKRKGGRNEGLKGERKEQHPRVRWMRVRVKTFAHHCVSSF
jgi:hypothetical protein